MQTELQVKNTGTASSNTIPYSNLLREIYVSLYANTLAFKASMRAGTAYIDGSETDLVACDLLEVSSSLLKTAPDLPIDDANTLQQFSDFIQHNVLDFAQTKASGETISSNSLQMELAHCQEIAIRECRFILGLASDADGGFFVLSEAAKGAVSTLEPGAMRSLWSQLLAARTFLLKAVDLFAVALQDIKSSRKCEPGASYQEYKAFAPLIWVANSLYDIAPEGEINSSESLDKYLEAVRFQFPVLNEQGTEREEHCNELLEQCLSEARVAGLSALQITLIVSSTPLLC